MTMTTTTKRTTTTRTVTPLLLLLLLVLLAATTNLLSITSIPCAAAITISQVAIDPASGETAGVVKEEDDDNDDDEEEDDEDIRPYYEFTDVDDFPYYPGEFEGDGRPADVCTGNQNVDQDDCIVQGQFILQDFVVAGVNLASYGVLHPKFRLFDDFNIGTYLKGNESWKELLYIRRTLERPSLSWYVDKVARKRWLHDHGYPQPKVYWMKYQSEITSSSSGASKEETAAVILANLPTKHGFCAKPTHMSMTMGNWLVDLDPNQMEDIKFSRTARQLKSNNAFDPEECADSLAEGLSRNAASVESWALKQVEPGIVVEELWSRRSARDLPPYELCIFVVWGRVYAAVMNEVSKDRYLDGFFYRDGSAALGCPYTERIPEWVPWGEMVAIAESLGANKDMIRIDMFVGVPRYTEGEDPELQISISESEIHPTTMFCNPFIADEMARLWVAGYKMGNYEVVPNDEVPADYVQRQKARNGAN